MQQMREMNSPKLPNGRECWASFKVKKNAYWYLDCRIWHFTYCCHYDGLVPCLGVLLFHCMVEYILNMISHAVLFVGGQYSRSYTALFHWQLFNTMYICTHCYVYTILLRGEQVSFHCAMCSFTWLRDRWNGQGKIDGMFCWDTVPVKNISHISWGEICARITWICQNMQNWMLAKWMKQCNARTA